MSARAGLQERDAVAADVAASRPSDFQKALRIIRTRAQFDRPFSANDLRAEMDGEAIPRTVIGTAFLYAIRQGIVRNTGDTVTSTDPGTKAKRLPLYAGPSIPQVYRRDDSGRFAPAPTPEGQTSILDPEDA